MILSIGEILADMIGEKIDGVTTFKAFCGGAPFNLAVNAKQSGAKLYERHEFLGEVSRLFGRSVAIAGTHGKTSTTAMVTHILKKSNLKFLSMMSTRPSYRFENCSSSALMISEEVSCRYP